MQYFSLALLLLSVAVRGFLFGGLTAGDFLFGELKGNFCLGTTSQSRGMKARLMCWSMFSYTLPTSTTEKNYIININNVISNSTLWKRSTSDAIGYCIQWFCGFLAFCLKILFSPIDLKLYKYSPNHFGIWGINPSLFNFYDLWAGLPLAPMQNRHCLLYLLLSHGSKNIFRSRIINHL